MDLSKNEAELLKEAYRLIADYNKYFPETETAISDFEIKFCRMTNMLKRLRIWKL